jgi:hypothetical protein
MMESMCYLGIPSIEVAVFAPGVEVAALKEQMPLLAEDIDEFEHELRAKMPQRVLAVTCVHLCVRHV